MVRRGIQEAELQLQRANEQKLMEEVCVGSWIPDHLSIGICLHCPNASISHHQGVLRQIPLVGSMLNWLSPSQSSVKGRTFNLALGMDAPPEKLHSCNSHLWTCTPEPRNYLCWSPKGSLDTTEPTYSSRTQTGGETPPATPTSTVSKQLSGNKPHYYIGASGVLFCMWRYGLCLCHGRP